MKTEGNAERVVMGTTWRRIGRQMAHRLGGRGFLEVSEKLEGVGVRELEGQEAMI